MVTPLFDSSHPAPWVHPCLRCGACCALYRVSFYWAEASDASDNGVPVALTGQLTPHRRVMLGTDTRPTRCVALEGHIGERVQCSIHPQRPSPCRDFAPSLEDGTPNPRCDQARAAWQLPPLTATDWIGRPDDDEPPPPRLPRVA